LIPTTECQLRKPKEEVEGHLPDQWRRRAARLAVMAVAVVVGLGYSLGTARDYGGVPAIAFFGFELINTSLEPATAAEDQRIRMLDDLFREKLSASGRFTIVAISPDVQRDVATGPAISNCNGCERDYAKRTSANWAAWGTVQKVSNLILNINVYMEDVQTGKLEFVKSVDIRGNTDESWQHGLDYMLRHYLFGEP
jgi:hypothetical protein